MTAIRIRGLGLITSYGVGVASTVDGMRTGRDGITPLTHFTLPFQKEIRVNQFDHTPFPPGAAAVDTILDDIAHQALTEAGLESADLNETAVVMGASSFLFAGEDEYRLTLANTGEAVPPPIPVPGRYAQNVAARFGMVGPVLTLSTACSSSANALLVGAALLRRGKAKRALVVGLEGLSAGALTGFYSMMLLDPDGCRPFDAKRRGMQIGEAMGAVLLEATDDDSGDTLLGGANLCDIHHMTSASPDGSAMKLVMEMALRDAGVSAGDIKVIKAHGTGSSDNDTAEAAAMRTLFGDALPPFTGLKRYLGHTLGACGVVEIAALLGCLRAGFVPPTLGCTQPDPALHVTPLAQSMASSRGPVMFNFFGFGGNYASLIINHG